MRLILVDPGNEAHVKVLYDLLAERPAEAAISHKRMPSFEEHCAFVTKHPYEAWYLIEVANDIVGAIYLTPAPRKSIRGNEIGIFVLKAHQGHGYGPEAIKALMAQHGPRRYLANISPRNARSAAVFEALGFVHCENTFELEAE